MGAEDDDGRGGAKAAGTRCRQTSAVAIRTFLDLMEEAAVDGRIGLDQARRIAEAIIGAEGPITAVYARAEAGCEDAFTIRQIDGLRRDRLGRLMARPFAHLFDEPGSGIERKNLPQFFTAIRMILGDDEYEARKARCGEIAEGCRDADGMVDWNRFHVDSEAAAIREQVQVAIARSFRRFEPRVDWFLIVMNSTTSAISLGSSAFIPRKAEDKPAHEFTERNFCRLFEALFADWRPENVDEARRAAFEKRWGSPPGKIFGPLFVDLQGLAGRAAG